ncbi:MAG: lytic transglycosylase, catalytic [Proteobacteria bacterium]|nr:lytic transglycosylase, catalytic [Pseudomonadota bacterium]
MAFHCSPRLLGLSLLALISAMLPLAAAAAGIYVYTAEDGAVSLSNVPEDPRYKVLLSDETAAVDSLARRSERRVGRVGNAKARYDQVVAQTALAYGLESSLLHAVISAESGYNPAAVSPKGARGLMQLMPATALRYGVADALDPVQNLQGGARYLRDLLKMFNSDKRLAVAAYNAGENAVARYGNQIPPYRETVSYVPKVMRYYEHYQTGSETR